MIEIPFTTAVEQRIESWGPVSVFIEDTQRMFDVLEGAQDVTIADFHSPGATVDFGAVAFAPESGIIPRALEGYIHFTPDTSRSSAFTKLAFIKDSILAAQLFKPEDIVTSTLNTDEAAEMCTYANGTILEIHIGTNQENQTTGIVQLRSELSEDAAEYDALIAMLVTWGIIRHSLSHTSYGKPQRIEINPNFGPENEHVQMIKHVYSQYIEKRNSDARTLPVLFLSDSDIANIATIFAPSEVQLRCAIQAAITTITEQAADTDYVGYIDAFTLAGALQRASKD